MVIKIRGLMPFHVVYYGRFPDRDILIIEKSADKRYNIQIMAVQFEKPEGGRVWERLMM